MYKYYVSTKLILKMKDSDLGWQQYKVSFLLNNAEYIYCLGIVYGSLAKYFRVCCLNKCQERKKQEQAKVRFPRLKVDIPVGV